MIIFPWCGLILMEQRQQKLFEICKQKVREISVLGIEALF